MNERFTAQKMREAADCLDGSKSGSVVLVDAAAMLRQAAEVIEQQEQIAAFVSRQRDLPEEAAKVLRENLWKLYD